MNLEISAEQSLAMRYILVTTSWSKRRYVLDLGVLYVALRGYQEALESGQSLFTLDPTFGTDSGVYP